jgi:hypothetical protein
MQIEDYKGYKLGANITGTIQPAEEEGVFTTRLPKIGGEIGKEYKGVTYRLMGEYDIDKKDAKIGFGLSN